jgi:hypothetical protein
MRPLLSFLLAHDFKDVVRFDALQDSVGKLFSLAKTPLRIEDLADGVEITLKHLADI